MSACVDAGEQWVPGAVGWSSTPLAEGVVMGEIAFARPAKPFCKLLADFRPALV
jgi:hypothetical protein